MARVITAPPLMQTGWTRVKTESLFQITWRNFLRHRPAVISSIIIVAIALLSIFANLSPYNPDRTRLTESLNPPSLEHPMGTDELGRDLATRILYGGRISLFIGVMSMLLAVSFGTIIGAL